MLLNEEVSGKGISVQCDIPSSQVLSCPIALTAKRRSPSLNHGGFISAESGDVPSANQGRSPENIAKGERRETALKGEGVS